MSFMLRMACACPGGGIRWNEIRAGLRRAIAGLTTEHMRSEIETLVAQFTRDNESLVEPTAAMLGRLIGDRQLHARFMNTLSMLEHLGSHKIMATQHGPAIDQPTLKHLAEEARHAFFFKRQAEREAGRQLANDAAGLLAPLPARRYFQRLEAEIVRALPKDADRRAAYLTMSMIVEFRAVWGYRLYQTALTRAGHALSLKSLLAEEAGHLTDMAERLRSVGQFSLVGIRALCGVEKSLYERLLATLSDSGKYKNAA